MWWKWYMDGEEEMYNDETDEYEEGLECDGFVDMAVTQGEMTGASCRYCST